MILYNEYFYHLKIRNGDYEYARIDYSKQALQARDPDSHDYYEDMLGDTDNWSFGAAFVAILVPNKIAQC